VDTDAPPMNPNNSGEPEHSADTTIFPAMNCTLVKEAEVVTVLLASPAILIEVEAKPVLLLLTAIVPSISFEISKEESLEDSKYASPLRMALLLKLPVIDVVTLAVAARFTITTGFPVTDTPLLILASTGLVQVEFPVAVVETETPHARVFVVFRLRDAEVDVETLAAICLV
jgi:hypothetical protein